FIEPYAANSSQTLFTSSQQQIVRPSERAALHKRRLPFTICRICNCTLDEKKGIDQILHNLDQISDYATMSRGGRLSIHATFFLRCCFFTIMNSMIPPLDRKGVRLLMMRSER
uniref:Uncharacterized protein n=1 Tax=Parascaris univalens TaxID=6257 RepID=A0A915A686_PARUN